MDDARQLSGGLLRSRHERPRCRSAQNCDELASSHVALFEYGVPYSRTLEPHRPSGEGDSHPAMRRILKILRASGAHWLVSQVSRDRPKFKALHGATSSVEVEGLLPMPNGLRPNSRMSNAVRIT